LSGGGRARGSLAVRVRERFPSNVPSPPPSLPFPIRVPLPYSPPPTLPPQQLWRESSSGRAAAGAAAGGLGVQGPPLDRWGRPTDVCDVHNTHKKRDRKQIRHADGRARAGRGGAPGAVLRRLPHVEEVHPRHTFGRGSCANGAQLSGRGRRAAGGNRRERHHKQEPAKACLRGKAPAPAPKKRHKRKTKGPPGKQRHKMRTGEARAAPCIRGERGERGDCARGRIGGRRTAPSIKCAPKAAPPRSPPAPSAATTVCATASMHRRISAWGAGRVRAVAAERRGVGARTMGSGRESRAVPRDTAPASYE
jgi:hypothetical protein